MHVERWGVGEGLFILRRVASELNPTMLLSPVGAWEEVGGEEGGGGIEACKLFHFQFCLFLPCFCVAIWRSSKTWISSYQISLKRTRCLVSTSSSLFQFGATFMKIFYPEGRWCSVGNCEALILGMQYLPI